MHQRVTFNREILQRESKMPIVEKVDGKCIPRSFRELLMSSQSVFWKVSELKTPQSAHLSHLSVFSSPLESVIGPSQKISVGPPCSPPSLPRRAIKKRVMDNRGGSRREGVFFVVCFLCAVIYSGITEDAPFRCTWGTACCLVPVEGPSKTKRSLRDSCRYSYRCPARFNYHGHNMKYAESRKKIRFSVWYRVWGRMWDKWENSLRISEYGMFTLKRTMTLNG